MNNYIISIPATIDFEVQAENDENLLPVIKEALADFAYAINMDVSTFQVTDAWAIHAEYARQS
jgi:hypothetical protein